MKSFTSGALRNTIAISPPNSGPPSVEIDGNGNQS